jgi:hypothetical protein
MLIDGPKDLFAQAMERSQEAAPPVMEALTKTELVPVARELLEECDRVLRCSPLQQSLGLPTSEASEQRVVPASDDGAHGLAEGQSGGHGGLCERLPFAESSGEVLVRESREVSPQPDETPASVEQLLPSV